MRRKWIHHHGARYYAPWFGRWISSDPVGLADGLNFTSLLALGQRFCWIQMARTGKSTLGIGEPLRQFCVSY